jgi:hypothetical protein
MKKEFLKIKNSALSIDVFPGTSYFLCLWNFVTKLYVKLLFPLVLFGCSEAKL